MSFSTAMSVLLLIAPFATGDERTFSLIKGIFNSMHRRESSSPSSEISINRQESGLEQKWIRQNLDHFNPSENATWLMRYMENDQYFTDGGPMFIFVGGEWDIISSLDFIFNGHVHDMAKEHKGYLFLTEHRFYGKSQPTENLSVENLKYLNSKQAIADLAHFIRTKKSTISGLANSKVILTGGSYSASLVTWFGRVHPELVSGCWASSAPLLAKTDFDEFIELTGESIKLVSGEACYNRIHNGIRQILQMVTNRSYEKIKNLFNICDSTDFGSELNIWIMFRAIFLQISKIVNNVYEIEGFCNSILHNEDDLIGLASRLKIGFDGDPCWSSDYQNYVEKFSNISFNTYEADRQWLYQSCNEFGWFPTSSSRENLFGQQIPFQLLVSMCFDLFGTKFNRKEIDRKIMNTNRYFGGLNPQVTNVVWTHGQLDPWRILGVQNSTRTKVISMHGHVCDMDSISTIDSAELKESKETVAELIREWIHSD